MCQLEGGLRVLLCVCVCVCILYMLAVLYLVFEQDPPLSPFSGGMDGYVFGGVGGGIVFVSCIVIVAGLRVWLMARKRSRNVEAAQANPTSAGTGTGRRVCRVPLTNPDPPPPYVLSTIIQSSDPPPYPPDPSPYPPDPPPYPTDSCPLPTSLEDTPTPQPFPPESPPLFPNDEDPPEYLPPPEGDQQQTPL